LSPIVADGSLRCSLAQVVQAKVQQIYADRALPYPGGDLRWEEPFVKWTQTLARCCRYPGLVSLDAETAKLDVDDCCHQTDKQAHLKVLFTHLWQGQVGAAINYLRQQVTLATVKNGRNC